MPVEVYELVIKGKVSAAENTQAKQGKNAARERGEQAPVRKTVRVVNDILKLNKER